VIGVTQKYSQYFTGFTQYSPGATFQYLPEHTWALGVTYAKARTMVALDVSGIGQITKLRDDFFLRNLNTSIRLAANRLNFANSARYISFNRGYAMANLNASHRLSSQVEGVLQVQNLADYYRNDYDARYANIGRQTKLGLRVKL
jgi:hypothetical protein